MAGNRRNRSSNRLYCFSSAGLKNSLRVEALEDRRLLALSYPIDNANEQVVNSNATVTNLDDQFPAVASNPNTGDFVVVWEENPEESLGVNVVEDGNIVAQRYEYDSDVGYAVPAGSPFQVNVSVTTYRQSDPAIAMDNEGNFIIVWHSDEAVDPTPNPSDELDVNRNVYARRFEADGTPIDTIEFLVPGDTNPGSSADNTLASGVQWAPSVAMDAEGSYFIVTWTTDHVSSGNEDIYGRQYTVDPGDFSIDADEVFAVSNSADEELYSHLSLDGTGDFLVSWTGGAALNNLDVFCRLFDTPSSTIPALRVNASTTGSNTVVFAEIHPRASSSDSIEISAFWQRATLAGTRTIEMQSLSADDAANTAPTRAGSDTPVQQYDPKEFASPSFAMDSSGDVVVTWSGTRGVTSGDREVSFRRTDNGTFEAFSPYERQANVLDSGTDQMRSAAAYLANGDFVLVWAGDFSGPANIYQRQYHVAPTADIDVPAVGVRAQTQSFELLASDPSPYDDAGDFTFEVDWGDGSTNYLDTVASGTIVTHSYSTGGLKTVTIWATDRRGAKSAPVQKSFELADWSLDGSGNFTLDLTDGEDIVGFDDDGPNGVEVAISQLDGVAFSYTFYQYSITGHMTVHAKAGDDQLLNLFMLSPALELHGGDGADLLFGSQLDDTIYGDAGNDTILGLNGADELYGGDDDDELAGDFGAFTTTPDADTLDGGVGNDTILGEGGGDLITGGLGNDELAGGDGDDAYLFPQDDVDDDLGDDTISEGGATVTFGDFIDLTNFGAGVSLNLAAAISTAMLDEPKLSIVRGSGTVEGIFGTDFDDILVGTTSNNWLQGNDGNDTIQGGRGNDTLAGTAGNDVYLFERSRDTIDLGSDVILESAGATNSLDILDFTSFDAGAQAITVNLAASGGQAVNIASKLVLTVRETLFGSGNSLGIEGVRGTALGDSITGNSRANVLLGEGGNDTILGGDERDILIGGLGADTLSGESGEDLLLSGRIDFDSEEWLALVAILSEWTSARSYADRVANISGTGVGTRNNGDYFLDDTTAFDDDSSAVDSLTGGSGVLDWFLYDIGEDSLTDHETVSGTAEEQTDLD